MYFWDTVGFSGEPFALEAATASHREEVREEWNVDLMTKHSLPSLKQLYTEIMAIPKSKSVRLYHKESVRVYLHFTPDELQYMDPIV